MELDHIFLFVPDMASAHAMMADAGLRVNHSRTHKGQGTRNLCACLDDVFLELLWLDGSPIEKEAERITLGVRGRGSGSPIGVSWRGPSDIDCEYHAAPFLPKGAIIQVARASLDPSLPFVFRSPGGVRPIDQKDDLAGDRQTPEIATLAHCELSVPNPVPVSALLSGFKSISVIDGPYGLALELLAADGSIIRKFKWTGWKT